ncbi:hypothetical protein ALC53_10896 [Atta colombica]|uniref:Uncharacterized protein n=1 Tax=Atta colombica TaxID=520822 RepID=A0A151HZR2_9HYME|nr:hypothetical protein ALC53_10896 [Atta colombica]
MRILINPRSEIVHSFLTGYTRFLLSSLSATIYRWPAVHSGISIRQILTASGRLPLKDICLIQMVVNTWKKLRKKRGIQAWVLEGDCRQNVKHREVRVLSLRFLVRIPSDSPPGTHRSTLPYCLVVLSAYSSLTSSPLGPTLQFPLFFT